MGRKLRSGYTTGACAAAAARAAATALLSRTAISRVEVVFPDNSLVEFDIAETKLHEDSATASVIKDAGDDPDVTNGALIRAEVRFIRTNDDHPYTVEIAGGVGVGMVTKPGLAVEVGKPAINPVPMRMIKENICQVIDSSKAHFAGVVQVIIEVPDGLELAQKTLNERLGIIGGISILGTTGIVRPVSAEAWTATIRSSMDVAEANGVREIILSTGRTSEKCIQKFLNPREEALVMMGDYLEFSLKSAHLYQFDRIHVATMWAKLLKGAMGYPQTHVRHGALEPKHVCGFFADLQVEASIIERIASANTAREILDILLADGNVEIIHSVCRHASRKYRETAGLPVSVHLVSSNGTLLFSS